MLKKSGLKLTILAVVLMMGLSGVANASTIYDNLWLRIEDDNGTGVVIQYGGVGDTSGADGVLNYTGNIGAFFVTTTIGVTQYIDNGAMPPVNVGSTLTLSAHVTHQSPGSLSGNQIRITLIDSGYTIPTPAIVTLNGVIQGAYDLSTGELGTQAQITNGSGAFNTWINTANTVPSFGPPIPEPGAPVNPNDTAVIAGLAAFGPSGYSAGSGAFSTGPTGGWTGITGSYAVISQATLTFGGGPNDSADFSLTGNVTTGQSGDPLESTSVPEPTSLLLLGSGLAGLGLLRFKKRPTA